VGYVFHGNHEATTLGFMVDGKAACMVANTAQDFEKKMQVIVTREDTREGE
jgi:hypothetical protein